MRLFLVSPPSSYQKLVLIENQLLHEVVYLEILRRDERRRMQEEKRRILEDKSRILEEHSKKIKKLMEKNSQNVEQEYGRYDHRYALGHRFGN